MIIDFHTHTFPDKIAVRVMQDLARDAHVLLCDDGRKDSLIASMKRAHIDYAVNLPVMTKVSQVEKVNSSMIAEQESLLQRGIVAFGGMHPDYPDYKKELRRLAEHHIPGIKLHPAYQGIMFDDIRTMRIVDAACEAGLIVLTHAGMDIDIVDQNYCSVPQILHLMETVRPDRLILAHMGGLNAWDMVERHIAGAPVWMDTSFVLTDVAADPNSEIPPIYEKNLTAENFLRLARKHGTDKILFATDSPWSDPQEYVHRIQALPLTQREQEDIFWKNALLLLGPQALGLSVLSYR